LSPECRQNHDIKTANRSFENVTQFKYLGTTTCYHSVQNLWSFHLLSIDLKVRIYKTIISLVVLYGRETWSLALREEHRLRVFGNRVLSRIFGPKGDEVIGDWRKLHNVELHNLFWHSDPLLGNDRENSNYRTATAK
jgi:hypothetical protein